MIQKKQYYKESVYNKNILKNKKNLLQLKQLT
jgi:hypothetical protein